MKPRHWKRSLILALLLGIIPVVGCAPVITQTPSPTLQLLTVGMPPALRVWKAEVVNCAEDIPGYGLVLDEVIFEADTWDRYDVVLSLGLEESFSGFSTQIGEENLAWVVNSENPIESIPADVIQSIYTGVITDWAKIEVNGASYTQPISAWTYPERDILQQVFREAAGFPGAARIEALIAPDPAAMLEVVASEPGAIGYIPTGWLRDPTEGVKQAAWDGEPVVLPVLGLAESEPQGAVRSLLVCLDQLAP
jgi:hypothetical protein